MIYYNVTMTYVKFSSQNMWASVKLHINSYNMFIITFILIILLEKLTKKKNLDLNNREVFFHNFKSILL